VPWRGGQVILGIISVTVVFLLLAWLVVSKIGIDQPSLVLLLTSLIVGLAILLAVALIALRPYRVSLITLGITPLGVPRVKVAVMTVVVLGLSLGATGLYAALVQSIGIERLQPPEIPPGIVLPGAGAALTFVALVLWTPFTEEVFFRGFVFAGLWPRLGSTGAIIVSALIFSLFHPDPGVLIPIFITGVLLAWLYRRTGSLWPSIVAHAGQNGIALTVTMLGL
jgi:membrane protease YdiL (CAAX protease family)